MQETSIEYSFTKKGCVQLIKHLPYNKVFFYSGCIIFLVIGYFEFMKSLEVAKQVAGNNYFEERVLFIISFIIEIFRFVLAVTVLYFIGVLINQIKGNRLYKKFKNQSEKYTLFYLMDEPYILLGEKRRKFSLNDKLKIVATNNNYLFYSGKPWKLDTIIINREKEKNPDFKEKLDFIIGSIVDQYDVKIKRKRK